MKKQRRTAQLAATWEVLAGAKDHPSAEEILRRVRSQLPHVSLGTVYRNLEKLRGLGRAQVLRFGEGIARYDALIDDHDHFICERCGNVVDLRPAYHLDVSALERQGFVIHSRSSTLYGICPDCGAEAQSSSDSA